MVHIYYTNAQHIHIRAQSPNDIFRNKPFAKLAQNQLPKKVGLLCYLPICATI